MKVQTMVLLGTILLATPYIVSGFVRHPATVLLWQMTVAQSELAWCHLHSTNEGRDCNTERASVIVLRKEMGKYAAAYR